MKATHRKKNDYLYYNSEKKPEKKIFLRTRGSYLSKKIMTCKTVINRDLITLKILKGEFTSSQLESVREVTIYWHGYTSKILVRLIDETKR